MKTTVGPKIVLSGITLALSAVLLAGCAGTSSSASASASTGGKDAALAKQVPAKYRSGTLTLGAAAYEPYVNYTSGTKIDGLVPDLAEQIGKILGVKIQMKQVSADAVIPGVQSGRFQLSAPSGDFTERQQKVDFVDFAQSNVATLLRKGGSFSPKKILDFCGRPIAVENGTGTQNVIAAVSQACEKAGKAAVEVHAYADQNAEILAVQSARVDAMVAPVAATQVAAARQPKKFSSVVIKDMQSLPAATATYGIMVPKGSGLAKPVRAALLKLEKDGTYAKLFSKWEIPASKIPASKIKINGSTQSQAS